jgi:hypothetical protein
LNEENHRDPVQGKGYAHDWPQDASVIGFGVSLRDPKPGPAHRIRPLVPKYNVAPHENTEQAQVIQDPVYDDEAKIKPRILKDWDPNQSEAAKSDQNPKVSKQPIHQFWIAFVALGPWILQHQQKYRRNQKHNVYPELP